MRWGLLGYGGIAPRFQKSIEAAEGESVVAIASRSNAEHALVVNPGVRVYDTYQKLFDDPEVEIIYISTTHNFHFEHTCQALTSGKHVLCEKPLGISTNQVREMFEVAEREKRFLMEGMWTRFLPAYRAALRAIRDGAIGEPLFIQADFSFSGKSDPEKRHLNPLLAGGGLFDVGVYPISLANDIFGGIPDRVYALKQTSETGVDQLTSMLFQYQDRAIAQLNGGVKIQMENSARIYGESGFMHIPLFWMAQSYAITRDGKTDKQSLPFTSTGFYHEILAASAAIRSGQLTCPSFSREDSLRSAETVDLVMAAWDQV